MSDDDTLSTETAFQRYEAVRHRFPSADFPDRSMKCDGLVEIADEFDAFLLDGFGVLNVGGRPVPRAAGCLETLRSMGKRLVVLTNAASHTRARAVGNYRELGFDFTAAEVVSSRDVAATRLGDMPEDGVWGAIAAPEDGFDDIDATVRHWRGGDADGFLLLSGAAFTPGRFARLEEALRVRPRPVIVANPDIVAPRETGLSKEPGYYAHSLADRLDIDPEFFGKPFGNAFERALRRIPAISPERVAMVGDTLHTDILGGRAAGLRTILVRDFGLYAGADIVGYMSRSGITPDYECGRI